MKRVLQILLGVIFIASTSLWAVPVGAFVVVKGNVQVKPEKGKWTKATVGMKFDAKTEIQTSLTGNASIKFVNDTVMNITPGTSINIARMIAGSYGTATDVQLSLGRIKTFIAKPKLVEKRNHFRVITPTVVAAVRGSEQEVGYTPEKGTEVIMHEHVSDIVNNKGMKSQVPQGGKSIATPLQTTTPETTATHENTIVFANGKTSNNETGFMFDAGDPMFSGNTGDVIWFYNFSNSLLDELYNIEFPKIDFSRL